MAAGYHKKSGAVVEFGIVNGGVAIGSGRNIYLSAAPFNCRVRTIDFSGVKPGCGYIIGGARSFQFPCALRLTVNGLAIIEKLGAACWSQEDPQN
jgi:hypothetical protein